MQGSIRLKYPPFWSAVAQPISQVDISSLTADALEPLNGDLWLLSPACQPYTVLNPNAKGAADPRAQSFLHLMEEVLPALAERGAAPTRLLIENVAGFEVRGGALSSTLPLMTRVRNRHPQRELVCLPFSQSWASPLANFS